MRVFFWIRIANRKHNRGLKKSNSKLRWLYRKMKNINCRVLIHQGEQCLRLIAMMLEAAKVLMIFTFRPCRLKKLNQDMSKSKLKKKRSKIQSWNHQFLTILSEIYLLFITNNPVFERNLPWKLVKLLQSLLLNAFNPFLETKHKKAFHFSHWNTKMVIPIYDHSEISITINQGIIV